MLITKSIENVNSRQIHENSCASKSELVSFLAPSVYSGIKEGILISHYNNLPWWSYKWFYIKR